MRTLILKVAGILVVAFALGTAVGVLSPTEVDAGPGPPGPNCTFIQQCTILGACGASGCGSCERPYTTWSDTDDIGGCCGTIVSSGCRGCVQCPHPCIDC